MKAINPEGTLIPGISQGMLVESGKLLFLSGHVPCLEDGTLVGGGLGEQLHQVFLNISATLAAAGADFSNVARLTIYVRDYDTTDLDTIRRIRDSFVQSDRPPASALIGVAALFHAGVRVEVDAVAVV